MKLKACDLKEGDLIDLEGDPYADPKHDRFNFQYEYALVDHVEQETPDCVLIGIEGVDAFGFPTNHEIQLHQRGSDHNS